MNRPVVVRFELQSRDKEVDSKYLQRSHAGFFLMVEGSLIDSGNHEENLQYQYGEIKAFDESVKMVLDWINASPARRQHTLLIILPDHETGGFAVKGAGEKGCRLSRNAINAARPRLRQIAADMRRRSMRSGIHCRCWS